MIEQQIKQNLRLRNIKTSSQKKCITFKDHKYDNFELSVKMVDCANIDKNNFGKGKNGHLKKYQYTQSEDINECCYHLKKVMLQFELQLNRKSLMTNLITIMQRQLLQSNSSEIAKNEIIQIKKVQNQINTYLNYTNQLIAKTKVLKQQILVSRRNRAMFSVLFRDIEKQIQIYENQLKKCLIDSEQLANFYKQNTNKAMNRQKEFNLLLFNSQNSNNQNKNSLYLTQHNSIKQIANDFYNRQRCQNLVKPRKQYVPSEKRISREDHCQDTIELLSSFIEKVCLISQMNLNKMHQAMSPQGFVFKNDQLFKKVSKLNEHIVKYEKKINNLKKNIQTNKLVNEKQQNNFTIAQKCQKKYQNTTKKIILQPKYEKDNIDDQLIFNELSKMLIEQLNTNVQVYQQQGSSKNINSRDLQFIKTKTIRIIDQIQSIQLNNNIKTSFIQVNPPTQLQNQQALSSLLSNMKVYASYQRAFERMQFQDQYYQQKKIRMKNSLKITASIDKKKN